MIAGVLPSQDGFAERRCVQLRGRTLELEDVSILEVDGKLAEPGEDHVEILQEERVDPRPSARGSNPLVKVRPHDIQEAFGDGRQEMR